MIFAYSIVWIIIGAIIIAVSSVIGMGGALSGLSNFPSYSYGNSFPSIVDSIGAIVGVLVGTFVIFFGVTASYLKVQTDLVAEEVQKRLRLASLS